MGWESNDYDYWAPEASYGTDMSGFYNPEANWNYYQQPASSDWESSLYGPSAGAFASPYSDIYSSDLGSILGGSAGLYAPESFITDPFGMNNFGYDYGSNIYSSGIYGDDALPEGDTVNPMYSEEQLIEHVKSREDLSMDEKIRLLQDMKVKMGFVEPDAYGEDSSVVSPDEPARGLTWLERAMGAAASRGAATKPTSSPAPSPMVSKALQGATALKAMLDIARTLKGNEGIPRNARGSAQDVRWNNTGERQVQKLAKGGPVDGGLGSITIAMTDLAQRKGIVKGKDKGQADTVDARLSPGEYIMDAETVSALGDGNTEAGAAELDKMRVNIRKHKRAGGLNSIAAAAKPATQYLKGKK